MSESISYEIKTVDDCFHIPPGRIAVCLEEFQTSIELAHAIVALAKLDGHEERKSLAMPSWTWIDDGLKKQHMQLGEINCKMEPNEPNLP